MGAYWDDDQGSSSGSAYIFHCDETSSSQQAKLTGSDGVVGDQFGHSVFISGDYAIVGAQGYDGDAGYNQGSAYIYHCIDDLSLPVELSSFTATAGEGQITLRWRTEAEADNLGFHLYRALSPEGPYCRITPQLIPGAGTLAPAHEYSYTDREVVPGVTYWYKLEDVAFDGTRTQHGPVSAIPAAPNPRPEEREAPVQNFLSQNWPNPFNPDTYIRFGVREPGPVRLVVYNSLGQVVRVLVEGELGANVYTAHWDGRDGFGRLVASGVYFCRLKVGEFSQVRKLMLLN